MAWKTLDDIDVADQTVLVRVDVNVPMEGGAVSDATRIEKIVPTVEEILSKGGRPVLLAHFGRPKGQPVEAMSLRQILPAMETAFSGRTIRFAADCVGAPAKAAVSAMLPGEIVLLENTRFHPGEEKNDPELAAGMAALGDIYLNDAFSAAHRAHASTEGIARLLPHAAGRLMEAELHALEAALGHPERPVVAVVGGAKVSTKLDLLGNLVAKVDHLVIGGGMANTFLVAQGIEVGTSLAERDMAPVALEILAKAKAVDCAVHLPVDLVVARSFKAGAAHEVVPLDGCPSDAMILDIGPATVAALETVFAHARTLIWNGPMGAFEMPPFDAGTMAVARDAARRTRDGHLISVAGGGDTVAAVKAAGVEEDLTFVSTAGGAFLEWMEGKALPGVTALQA